MYKRKDIGVVIGRFQVDELHAGHIRLLDEVSIAHETMLVLVGYNDVRETPHNPLPVSVRIPMIEELYPDAIVVKLPDSKIGTEHWSETVDQLIAMHCGDTSALLYGSRNSFIPKYSGKHETCSMTQVGNHSGTEIRERIAGMVEDNASFRRGWIAAILNQFKITDPVVDVAIVSPDFSSILLGRRGVGAALRFPGGFVDRNDPSHEAAAMRELSEEVTGITTSDPEYVFSTEVESSRYGDSGYGMKTILFCVTYQSGLAKAGDDLDSVEWRDLNTNLVDQIDPSHVPLLHALLRYRDKQLRNIRSKITA